MNNLIEFTKAIIETYGYVGIFIMTALEQFIFPVPADIFVVMGTSAGLLFTKILIIILIAAFIGSFIGYYLGKYLGHPVVAWLFGKRRLQQGEKFIKKWGIWGIMLAGLTPIPFKIITWTAGVFEMPWHRFAIGVFIGRMPRYILTAYAGTLILKFRATTEMSALILGALQGVTEFLPISSSGHLVIVEQFLNLPLGASEMIIFDIILHGGSLLAILIYFWKDWLKVLQELWNMLKKWSLDKNSLALKLILGTIPAIIAGLLFGDMISDQLRQPASIGIFLISIALFYLVAESHGKQNKVKKVSLKNAVIIGIAQSLALIPGISRAGTTIATGMLIGLNRETAARFSFMLGGIAILAANVYALFSIRNGAMMPNSSFILIGLLTSFIFSLLAIVFLLRFLRNHTLRPFSFYLLLVGILILSFL